MNPFLDKDDKIILFISILIVGYISLYKLAGKTADDLLKFINGVVLTTARSVSAIFSGGSVIIGAERKKKKDYQRRKC